MPQLDVYTNRDAEVFVLDETLSLVARSVGPFSGDLGPGLYKIRVSRAGTFQEQLIELGAKNEQHHMFIGRFSAIAPIGPMLPDAGSVEKAYRAFQESGFDVRALLVALTSTTSFRTRHLPESAGPATCN